MLQIYIQYTHQGRTTRSYLSNNLTPEFEYGGLWILPWSSFLESPWIHSYAWGVDPPVHVSGDMCLSEYRWGSVMNIANWSSGLHCDPIFNSF